MDEYDCDVFSVVCFNGIRHSWTVSLPNVILTAGLDTVGMMEHLTTTKLACISSVACSEVTFWLS